MLDGKVLTGNINTIESFGIYYTTVEDFTVLKDLTVYNVGLKKLSQNKALESINFWYNSLRSLDLSQNTALKKAYINDSSLATLDFSNNFNLFMFSKVLLWPSQDHPKPVCWCQE